MSCHLRARLALALVIGAAGAIPAPASETRRAPRSYTIEQFMDTTAVRDASFSPDETPRPPTVMAKSGLFRNFRQPRATINPQAHPWKSFSSSFSLAFVARFFGLAAAGTGSMAFFFLRGILLLELTDRLLQ